MKKDLKKEDKKDEISLEDLIEKERANLGPNQVSIIFTIVQSWMISWLKKKTSYFTDKDYPRNVFGLEKKKTQ